MLTETALLLFQLRGASASAGLVGTAVSASKVSTSLAPPETFAWR